MDESWIGDPAVITWNRSETLSLLRRSGDLGRLREYPDRVWARMKTPDSTPPAFLGFTEDREMGL